MSDEGCAQRLFWYVIILIAVITAFGIGEMIATDELLPALERADAAANEYAIEASSAKLELAQVRSDLESATVEVGNSAMVIADLQERIGEIYATAGWQTTRASWYGPGLYGNHTADGTDYTTDTFCVAHKTLPLGTMIEIRYNGRTITVPVKDRGPYIEGRDLDLSAAAAGRLGFEGVHTVEWRIAR